MPNLDDILAARMALLERVPQDFAADVERVLNRLYPAVLEIANELKQSRGTIRRSPANVRRTLAMFDSLLNALDEAGYDEAARRYADRYADVIRQVQRVYGAQDLPSAFTQISREAWAAARTLDLELFEDIGTVAMREIQRGIAQSVLFEKDYTTLVQELKATIRGTDKRGAPLAARANTFALTAIQEFDRVVTRDLATDAGVTHFRYYGPLDSITRAWCKSRLRNNKPMTMEEIEALPKSPTNRGGSNFQSGGGWNCRHSWVPVPAKEARSVAA